MIKRRRGARASAGVELWRTSDVDRATMIVRSDVEAACRAHSVAVSDPLWGMALRRAHAFSGKPLRTEVRRTRLERVAQWHPSGS